MKARQLRWRTRSCAMVCLVLAGLGYFFPLGLPGGSVALGDPAPAPSLTIANIGDSYAAGLGISPASSGLCPRSYANYAHIAADIVHARVDDYSCSGAKISNFYQPQSFRFGLNTPSVPPQKVVLRRHPHVVLLSLGGNDVQAMQAIIQCSSHQYLYGCEGNKSRLFHRLPAEQRTITTLLHDIRRQVPGALIIVVGYGKPLVGHSCPMAPMGESNAQWLTNQLARLNDNNDAAARSVGALFFDPSSLGLHSLCSEHPWYNGLLVSPGQGAPGHFTLEAHHAIGVALGDIISDQLLHGAASHR